MRISYSLKLALASLGAIFLKEIHAVQVVSTATITNPAAAQATSDSYTSDTTFQSHLLSATNFYRTQHASPPLTWNRTCANYASSWVAACNFRHSRGSTGENLAAGYSNASAAVAAWALERRLYDFNRGGFAENTGHFTQLVWSNTTSMGCARKECDGRNGTPGWYVVCEYWPPGNVLMSGIGDRNELFRENVKRQVSGRATDTWNEDAEDGSGSGSGSATSTATAPGTSSTAESAGGKLIVGGLARMLPGKMIWGVFLGCIVLELVYA